jgi:DNA ligase 4
MQPNPKQIEEITVEEIDATLHHIASGCKFSSNEVRAARDNDGQITSLGDFYNRLTARDAKWFTRLVLKDFSPVVVPETIVIKAYDERLPEALAVREDFATAISLLRDGSLTSRPENLIKLGCKVARQPWHKAHSIKHCMGMIGRRQVSCEQKIDGEYCQIHIDLSKPRNQQIKIYSKSGKESTKDREKLHPYVLSLLHIIVFLNA